MIGNILLLICYIVIIQSEAEHDRKRILLSDPQYTHGIEIQLQELTSKVEKITTDHQHELQALHLEFNSFKLQQQTAIHDITSRITSSKGNVYVR